MVVARASGMDLASILKRNTFLTLGVRPAGGPGVRAGRGDREGPRDGGTQKGPGTGGPRDFLLWGFAMGMFAAGAKSKNT